MKKMPQIHTPVTFEWDDGNRDKNKIKHDVRINECEEVFFNTPIIIYDEIHSKKEERYQAYGETVTGRVLIITFTIRNGKIRVISPRDQHKKERSIYERYKKN